MLAEVLAIGTELLMGETLDTNSSYIAARLPDLGVELRHVTIVGDNPNDMTAALERGLERSDIILVSGGLGPTQDDITREIIASVLSEDIFVDKLLVEHLRQTFARRGMGLPAPALNLKQASLIPSAKALSNPIGTAPGWWAEKDGKIIVAMPGVPSELEKMWDEEVTPRLRNASDGIVITSRTLKTFGMTEAAVGEKVQAHFGSENPYLGIYARPDGIHLRIIAKGSTNAVTAELIDPMEQSIRQILAEFIWGVDNDKLEEQVGILLNSRNQTIGAMESCTGGLLGSVITDIPGSSSYFKGSIIAYHTDVKTNFGVAHGLITQHGAVSREVAVAMAEAARNQLGSDIGVGITGVAGPSETDGVTVGQVFIGIASQSGSTSTSMRFPPNRPILKRRAVTQALLQIFHRILETDQN